MRPRIGIEERNLEAVSETLNGLLADEFVLYAKTKTFYWNVNGRRASALRSLFKDHSKAVGKFTDQVAKRIRAVGGYACGALEDCIEQTELSERANERLDADGMIETLLIDHETIARRVRDDAALIGEKHGDDVTEDFLVMLVREHESIASELRSFFEEFRAPVGREAVAAGSAR